VQGVCFSFGVDASGGMTIPQLIIALLEYVVLSVFGRMRKGGRRGTFMQQTKLCQNRPTAQRFSRSRAIRTSDLWHYAFSDLQSLLDDRW
jgi:hypothetical protein